MPPAIGKIVHYVEPHTGIHQAAVVTSVDGTGVGAVVHAVTLTVLGADRIGFERDVPYSAEHREGSWHWPEREEDSK